MQIDAETLNYIHNKLRALVGEQGAFILFLVKPNGEGEDLKIRFAGPNSRVMGLLSACSAFTAEHMKEKFGKIVSQEPTEPD